MKYILSIIFVFLFFLSSCSNSNIFNHDSVKHNSGQAALNFDKNGIPSKVVSITAYLIRNKADTLMRKIDIVNNPGNSIIFTGVPLGKWHLKMIAQNKAGSIIYSGTDDILIKPGETSNVKLNLMPDKNKTGSVHITVNWGKSNQHWLNYPDNPIFTRLNNPSRPNGVSTAKIIFDKGIYKMFYICIYNSGKGNIWYAESSNGITWQNILEEPVFENDTRGTWDDYTVGPGAIIKDDNGNYKLYYNGWSSQEGKWQVGLALSTDCIHWHRYPYPVLKANDSNEFKIGAVSVIKNNNLYYMYYSSSPRDNYNNMRINLAVSRDGIHWDKYSGNPILSPSFPWEGIGVTFPAVIYDNNRFVMIYSSKDRTKFGIAYSKDGKNWIKNFNYEFSNMMTRNKWSQINYPFLLKVGNKYRLYYTATSSNNSMEICLLQASKL